MRSGCHAVSKRFVKLVSYYRDLDDLVLSRIMLTTMMSLGQASLPDTCPVCAHTPLSSDLCKPNKALRTTLKAFLRTEEKKREKDRQSATPAAPAEAAPVDGTPAPSEQPAATPAPHIPAAAAPEEQAPVEEQPKVAPAAEVPPEEYPAADSQPVEAGEEPVSGANAEVTEEAQSQVVGAIFLSHLSYADASNRTSKRMMLRPAR